MRLFMSFALAVSSFSLASAQDHGWSSQSAINMARPASSGSSSNVLVIRIRDKCDPTTFNDSVGPGACVGDGNVTFAEFLAELTEDQKVGAWRFNPDQTQATLGQMLRLESRAGETHTFTQVKYFGGGFVDALNVASGNLTPAPECLASNISEDFVVAGGTMTKPLPPPLLYAEPGEQKFQCCIHPWMRTIVKTQGAH